MYIQKKTNRTGSVSVYVMGREDGRLHIVKNFGVARSPEEVASLEREAQRYINEQKGPELDLFRSERDATIINFLSSLRNSQFQVIGPELIYGALYDRIGYSQIDNEMFRHLVITRLFNPGSKLKSLDYLSRYLGARYRIDQIYRFLDNLCYREGGQTKKPDIKSQVEQVTFEYTRKVSGGQVSIVFYDMTTLYFEASDEDDLRITGFSKDGKHTHPQIYLGLLVAAGGNPIGYEIFEGNTSEGHTLIPVLEGMAERFGLERPVVVADAGLLSRSNLKALQDSGYEYILGGRPRNEGRAIQEAILSRHLSDGEVAIIERDADTRLVVSRTGARRKKDAANRQKGLQRLQKRLGSGRLTKSSINNRGYNRYLRLEGDVTVSIDMARFEADGAWDGIKAYVTNTSLPAEEVIASYSHLWYIERAFRMNKTDLRIRPIYHRLRNRIEGHICICFAAYTVMLELERILKKAQSKLTLKGCRELVNSMYQVTYILPDSKRQGTNLLRMDEQQQELYILVSDSCAC